jgi:hypothetical protein
MMRHTRRMLPVVTLMLAALASCGVIEPGEDEIVLTNHADVPWIALVVELETSHLLDPSPRFDVAGNEMRVIAPGASRTFTGDDVEGGYTPGDDIRLFLYEVNAAEAVLEEMVTIEHAELAARRFHIDIP